MNSDLALIMALPSESKGLFEQAGIRGALQWHW